MGFNTLAVNLGQRTITSVRSNLFSFVYLAITKFHNHVAIPNFNAVVNLSENTACRYSIVQNIAFE